MRGALCCSLAALVMVGACGSSGPEAHITWVRRADTASVQLPGSALWCAGPAWLELFAGRNDTGISVVVFPRDSLLQGQFPVVPVRQRDDSLRPMAGLAVRWFSDTELLAFEGHDGTVELEMLGELVTARLTGHLRVLAGDDTLDVTGSFLDVPVTRGGGACPAPGDSTSGVLD